MNSSSSSNTYSKPFICFREAGDFHTQLRSYFLSLNRFALTDVLSRAASFTPFEGGKGVKAALHPTTVNHLNFFFSFPMPSRRNRFTFLSVPEEVEYFEDHEFVDAFGWTGTVSRDRFVDALTNTTLLHVSIFWEPPPPPPLPLPIFPTLPHILREAMDEDNFIPPTYLWDEDV